MTTITIITHLFNAFLFIAAATGLYVLYEGIWAKRNKKRKPYNFEDQERIMKTVYPDDPEIDYTSWRKHIFQQRQLMN